MLSVSLGELFPTAAVASTELFVVESMNETLPVGANGPCAVTVAVSV